MDSSRVLIVARPESEVPHFGAEQDVLIRPLGEQPVPSDAGRYNMMRSRKVRVTVRTRVLLDPADQDITRLTDLSLGHLALEDAVADALELCQPNDAGDITGVKGNWLVDEPVRTLSLSETRPDPRAREWIESSLECEIVYSRAISSAFQ